MLEQKVLEYTKQRGIGHVVGPISKKIRQKLDKDKIVGTPILNLDQFKTKEIHVRFCQNSQQRHLEKSLV